MVSLFTYFPEAWISVFILLNMVHELTAQGIVGCPIFGCTPGGSFSFQLNVLSAQPRVKWKSSVLLEPLHNNLGCVGNSASIVCPIVSRKAEGYGGFSSKNGTVTWEDAILHHPPLPLMDIFGDIIGSDGEKLLQYRADGTVIQPVINLIPSMKDIFSLNLADNGILLLTSSFGVLTTYFTNGVPGGTVTLHHTVNNATGTFCPVGTPVISGHRSYMLTAFRADNSSSKENGLLRLFGIDLNDQFVGKIQVAWFIDLGHVTRYDSTSVTDNRLHHQRIQTFQNSAVSNSSLLVHNDMIFVALTASHNNHEAKLNNSVFWAVRDSGKEGFIKYTDSLSIDDLSLYSMSPAGNTNFHQDKNAGIGMGTFEKVIGETFNFNKRRDMSYNYEDEVSHTLMWGSQKMCGKITGFDLSGGDVKIITEIDLSLLLKTSTRITSKIMTVRNETDSPDSLVFGVSVMNKTAAFCNILKQHNVTYIKNVNYVICVKIVSESPPLNIALQWILPVPGDGTVSGQLVGIPPDAKANGKTANRLENSESIIVAYTVSETSTHVFAICLREEGV